MEQPRQYGISFTPVSCDSELELVKQMVYAYSCYTVMTKQNKQPLRPKLVDVLATYIILGYSQEVKKDLIVRCGLKNELMLNCLNKELRDQGYLLKGVYNTQINELSTPLKTMKQYIELKKKAGGDININMNFLYKREG